MTKPITLIIGISSGWEQGGTPAVQVERLRVLLRSIESAGDRYKPARVIVRDNYSENTEAQNRCRVLAEVFNYEYLLSPPPKSGPIFNGPNRATNYAIELCETEDIAILSDDTFVTPGWWDSMQYVVDNNDHIPWGMLGWSIVNSSALVNAGFLSSRSEFYTKSKKLYEFKLTEGMLRNGVIIHGGFVWGHPHFQKHCTGAAHIVKKSLWKQFGGFHEECGCGDEDYGENSWWVAKKYCIQLPTPPILHYEGGCGWPEDFGSGNISLQKGWETRPFCPSIMGDRGGFAFKVMNTINQDEALREFNFLLPNDPRREKIEEDRRSMLSRLGYKSYPFKLGVVFRNDNRDSTSL